MIRPTCSVCMATFNGEKFIYEQLKSILDQLLVTDEVIISDDGSTDNTIRIIQSFSDGRIKIFSNRSRRGPVGNFENAISYATGDYIFLADQDDVWFEGKIDKHLLLHENYDLVVSDAVVVNENQQILFESFFKARGSRAGLFKNLFKNSFLGCCMSFSRRIADYARPFPPGIHMHDWWIGLVAELKGRVVFCDDKLMRYVRHDSNASPTLGQSGYSFFKRMGNRLTLAWGLFFLKR
ncbi:MAG TPA: glycosyltransferase family 2 protein [Mucilaginibacter sp.]|nr:glycosyltransferase family 2 protein [Mucilaginibacter sp.]HVW99838.1 glycosyltransferase family 2 protein [Candidatus Babeliaceae bacterium]